MKTYEVRLIRLDGRGEWYPGDLIWSGKSAARAKEEASRHAWDNELGTCIITIEGGRPIEIDWGDRTERVG